MPRRTKSKDDDTHSESQSPLRLGDDQSGDGESSGVDRSMPAPEEPPYVPELWYGVDNYRRAFHSNAFHCRRHKTDLITFPVLCFSVEISVNLSKKVVIQPQLKPGNKSIRLRSIIQLVVNALILNSFIRDLKRFDLTINDCGFLTLFHTVTKASRHIW